MQSNNLDPQAVLDRGVAARFDGITQGHGRIRASPKVRREFTAASWSSNLDETGRGPSLREGSGMGDHDRHIELAAPAPIADFRGGPATAAGISYQLLVAVGEFVKALDIARYRPSDSTIFRVEPRHIVPGGQYGFDHGLAAGPAPDAGNEFVEVKRNPSSTDVVEFVSKAAAVTQSSSNVRLRLVAGAPTNSFSRLDALIRHGHEAISDDNFRAIVAASGDVEEARLLNHLGPTPKRTAASILAPQVAYERALDDIIDTVCRMIAVAGRAEHLRGWVRDQLEDAARRRSVIVMQVAVEMAIKASLLAHPPLVDTSSADAGIVAALTVLQVCPLPVLSNAMATITFDESTAAALDEQITLGRVVRMQACLGLHAPSVVQFPREPSREAMTRVLTELVAEAKRNPAAVASQTPNVLALAKECIEHAPEVVAETFVAFDKPSKAYGDLWLIHDLAETATRAVPIAVARSPQHSRQLAEFRARNYVCGSAWVLQRVEELEEAEQYTKRAREISVSIDDSRTAAFADKCSGTACTTARRGRTGWR